MCGRQYGTSTFSRYLYVNTRIVLRQIAACASTHTRLLENSWCVYNIIIMRSYIISNFPYKYKTTTDDRDASHAILLSFLIGVFSLVVTVVAVLFISVFVGSQWCWGGGVGLKRKLIYTRCGAGRTRAEHDTRPLVNIREPSLCFSLVGT